MKKYFAAFALAVLFSVTVLAQKDAKTPVPEKTTTMPAGTTATDVAKTALAAHGGDKLKQLKSLVMKGSVDLNVSNQIMPATFSLAFSGDKYFFEINSAVQPIKQVYDGRDTYSSIPGFLLPPVTSVGFPVLAKIGDAGYVIAETNDKKKRKGFRITAPDGFYTDFFVDEKTGQIKSYESSYEAGGRVITTSAQIDEVETIEGVVVPKKYSQRFDLGQITAYANFKMKDTKVNPQVADDAFVIPR